MSTRIDSVTENVVLFVGTSMAATPPASFSIKCAEATRVTSSIDPPDRPCVQPAHGSVNAPSWLPMAATSSNAHCSLILPPSVTR